MVKYNVIVTGPDETFIAYQENDEDSANGHADFCRASMPGAKVRVERIEWIPDEDR